MDMKRAWVVVADRRHARFHFHGGPGEPLLDAEPGEMKFPPQNEYADRPGRVHERSGTGRHGMEPSTHPGESELDTAGRAIAEALEKGAGDGAFDRVVIAATPKLIGAIRPHLSEAVNRRDVIEIRHRLLDLTPKELAERLDREGVVGRVKS